MASSRPLSRFCLGALLLSLGGMACGGTLSTTPGDASASSDGEAPRSDAAAPDAQPDLDSSLSPEASDAGSFVHPDAATDASVAGECPVSPPAPGSPCTVDGALCEYGPSWWASCNTRLSCVHGAWQPQTTGWLPCPFPAPDAGDCPPTYAEATSLDASAGLCPARDCQYPEGACACLSGCGGGGLVRENALPGYWTCMPATPPCPTPRPLLGTACPTPGVACNYSLNCGCGQNLTCTDGVWTGSQAPQCI